MSPKGPRTQAVERFERPDRDSDVSLIRQLEQCSITYDWERRLLEEASRRVFNENRSLLPRIREAVAEIISRRRGLAE